MTPKQFAKYLARDKSCWHCGSTEDLIPHHRKNRGMGGSKAANVPSNIIAMCAIYNGLMESSATAASLALSKGWKLANWEDPTESIIYHASEGIWCLLDDNYNRVEVQIED